MECVFGDDVNRLWQSKIKGKEVKNFKDVFEDLISIHQKRTSTEKSLRNFNVFFVAYLRQWTNIPLFIIFFIYEL